MSSLIASANSDIDIGHSASDSLGVLSSTTVDGAFVNIGTDPNGVNLESSVALATIAATRGSLVALLALVQSSVSADGLAETVVVNREASSTESASLAGGSDTVGEALAGSATSLENFKTGSASGTGGGGDSLGGASGSDAMCG